MVPKDVLKGIVERTMAEWPDDEQMQKHCVSEEIEAYIALHNLSFGDLQGMKDRFIDHAERFHDSWPAVLQNAKAEAQAYQELLQFHDSECTERLIAIWKEHAEVVSECSFVGQLGFLKAKAEEFKDRMRVRARVDRIKPLLIELERIIGNECYNGNIQNYAAWGQLDSEGRHFRYPVTFHTEKGKSKQTSVAESMPGEELLTGYYSFGANELGIYRALLKVVEHLEENYGLEV